MNCKNHTRTTIHNSRDEGHRNAPVQPFRYVKYRRRICLDCGERFTTYEMHDSQLKRLLKLAGKL